MNQSNNTKKEILEEFRDKWSGVLDLKDIDFETFLASALDRIEAEGRRMERAELIASLEGQQVEIEINYHTCEGWNDYGEDKQGFSTGTITKECLSALLSKKEPQQEK